MTRTVELALFTDEVGSARAFYERLLGVEPEAEWPGGAIFAAGEVKLLIHERAGARPDGPPNEDHVAFGVVDLDGACDVLLRQGVDLLLPPRDYAWGRSAYLRDPDGRLLELSQT